MNGTALVTSPVTESHVSARDVFLGVVSSALVELVAHYQLEVNDVRIGPDPDELRGHQVAGLIGFASDRFGGTLALRASSALVRRCLPISPVTGIDARALGDWIAELANQLLGRTKNKFVRHGISFQLTPPTYAAAHELLVLGCDPSRTSWLNMNTSAGLLLGMLELHAPDTLKFNLDEATVDVAAEGELRLF